MLNTTEALTSISDTAAFGTHLATVLHTYLELSWAARSTLEEVTAGVGSTASILRQLQHAVELNQSSHGQPRLLKEEGLIEVDSLAQKCHLVFRIIIAVVQKSCDTDKEGEVKVTLRGPSIREKAVDPSLGPGDLTVNLASKIETAWIQPRIDDCVSQLVYLKMSLLLNLQIANLANLSNRDLRQPGTLDQAVSFRTTAIRLRERQAKLARSEVNSRKKADGGLRWVRFDDKSVKSDAKNSDNPLAASGSSPGPAVTMPAVVPAPAPALGCEPRPTASEDPTSTAPPYSAHTPVGHQGVEGTPIAAAKPLSPEICVTPPAPADDARATKSDDQASPSGGVTAATSYGLDSASITALFRPTLSQRLRSWLRGVFGSHRANNNDKLNKLLTANCGGGSSVLEAYLLAPGNFTVKIPLGHEQLKHTLARILRGANKNKEVWPALAISTAFQSNLVIKAVEFAKKTVSPHQRTCIAIHELKTEGQLPSFLLFFTLAEPLPAVQFKDAVGREFAFSYELCQEWKDMHELIKNAFLHVEVIGPYVAQGCYDVLQENNKIILPSLWSTTITPGAHITMHMWPMNRILPQNPPRVHPKILGPPTTTQPQQLQQLGGGLPPPVARPAWGPTPLPGWAPHQVGASTSAVGGVPPQPPPPPGWAGPQFGASARAGGIPPPPPPPGLRRPWHKTKEQMAQEQKAQEADCKDMQVIDFRKEAKMMLADSDSAAASVADMIRRFTYIADSKFTAFDIEIDSDDDLYGYSDYSSDEDQDNESESESESESVTAND